MLAAYDPSVSVTACLEFVDGLEVWLLQGAGLLMDWKRVHLVLCTDDLGCLRFFSVFVAINTTECEVFQLFSPSHADVMAGY